MNQLKVAKVLEIGPYPPPMAGWSIRIRFVKDKLEAMGHECKVLNLGATRRIPSKEYITVRNGFDYIYKTFWYAARGYRLHMHTNGDGPIGFLLSLVAATAGCVFGRRIVLSMHAGTHQRYFPRERSRHYYPLMYLLFKLAKLIICNNDAVKEKIIEYGVLPSKIIPIKAFAIEYVERQDVELPDFVEQFFKRHDPVIFTYALLREGFHWDTLVAAMRLLRDRIPSIGLINAGSIDDADLHVKMSVLRQIEEDDLTDHICFARDLSHDEFLTAMRRSKLFLRTPTTDGECSSILEALTLGLPVVAAENNNRPRSVVTYVADNQEEMCNRIDEVLTHYLYHCEQIAKPSVRDTLSEEAEVLIAVALQRPIVIRKSSPLISSENLVHQPK